MGVSLLTGLIQDLAHIKDTLEKPATTEAVLHALETGKLVPWLKQLSEEAARVLSYLGEAESRWLRERFLVASSHYRPNKLGIQNCGLCYLISLSIVVLRSLSGYGDFRNAARNS